MVFIDLPFVFPSWVVVFLPSLWLSPLQVWFSRPQHVAVHEAGPLGLRVVLSTAPLHWHSTSWSPSEPAHTQIYLSIWLFIKELCEAYSSLTCNCKGPTFSCCLHFAVAFLSKSYYKQPHMVIINFLSVQSQITWYHIVFKAGELSL